MPRSYLAFFGVIALCLLAVFYRLTNPTAGCTITGNALTGSCSRYGSIILSDPQVFTREHLVNDRLKEERWLLQTLDATPVLKVTLDSFRALQESKTTAWQTDVNLGLSLGSSATPAENAAATTSGTTGSTVADQHIPLDLSPISQFRSIEVYRDEIRDELMASQLDDRHDISGNTLVRLSFNASILASRSTNEAALIYVAAQPPAPDDVTSYEDLYEEWWHKVQQQLDKATTNFVSAIEHETGNSSALPESATKLFKMYLRDRFIRESLLDIDVSDSIRAQLKMLLANNSWPQETLQDMQTADVVAAPLREVLGKKRWPRVDNTTDKGDSKLARVERAQALFYFFVNAYAERYSDWIFQDYARNVETAVNAAIETLPPEGRDGAYKALDAVRFCEDQANNSRGCDSTLRLGIQYYQDSILPMCTDRQLPGRVIIPLSLEALRVLQNVALQVPKNAGSGAPPDAQIGQPGQEQPGSAASVQVYQNAPNATLNLISGGNSESKNGNDKGQDLTVPIANIGCPPVISPGNAQLVGAIHLTHLMIDDADKVKGFRLSVLESLLAMYRSQSLIKRCTGAQPQSYGEAGCDLFPRHVPTTTIRQMVVEYQLWLYDEQHFVRTVAGDDPTEARRNIVKFRKYFDIRSATCGLGACNLLVGPAAVPTKGGKQETIPLPMCWMLPASDSSDQKLGYDLFHQSVQLCDDLNRDAMMYSYVVAPKLVSNNRATSENDLIRAAAAIAAKLNPAVNAALGASRSKEFKLDRVAASATLIAFALPTEEDAAASPLACGSRSAQDTPSSCFGWLIRPSAATRDGQDDPSAERYPVSVVLSVPSWWKSLQLKVWRCWVDPSAFVSDGSLASAPINACPTKKGEEPPSLTFSIPLPGTAREVSRKLGPQIITPPYIDQPSELLTQTLVAGRGGRLILQGERLWKSPRLILGDQPADEIEVLPDMQGIVGTFKCIDIPSGYESSRMNSSSRQASNGNAPPVPTISVLAHLWTNEGKTEPFPVSIVVPNGTLPCDAARPSPGESAMGEAQSASGQ